jgi:hypothetical protein
MIQLAKHKTKNKPAESAFRTSPTRTRKGKGLVFTRKNNKSLVVRLTPSISAGDNAVQKIRVGLSIFFFF